MDFGKCILQCVICMVAHSMTATCEVSSSRSEFRPISAACTAQDSIQLKDGNSNLNGRVEVCYDNMWGTVCDSGWSNADAKVVCRELGHATIGAVSLRNPDVHQGAGKIWLADVACDGTESALSRCKSTDPGIHKNYCIHPKDAGVKCLNDFKFTLGSGDIIHEGEDIHFEVLLSQSTLDPATVLFSTYNNTTIGLDDDVTIISRIVDFSNYETSQTLVVTTNQIDDQVEGNISITAFLSDASDDILISEPNKVVVIVIPDISKKVTWKVSIPVLGIGIGVGILTLTLYLIAIFAALLTLSGSTGNTYYYLVGNLGKEFYVENEFRVKSKSKDNKKEMIMEEEGKKIESKREASLDEENMREERKRESQDEENKREKSKSEECMVEERKWEANKRESQVEESKWEESKGEEIKREESMEEESKRAASKGENKRESQDEESKWEESKGEEIKREESMEEESKWEASKGENKRGSQDEESKRPESKGEVNMVEARIRESQDENKREKSQSEEYMAEKRKWEANKRESQVEERNWEESKEVEINGESLDENKRGERKGESQDEENKMEKSKKEERKWKESMGESMEEASKRAESKGDKRESQDEESKRTESKGGTRMEESQDAENLEAESKRAESKKEEGKTEEREQEEVQGSSKEKSKREHENQEENIIN